MNKSTIFLWLAALSVAQAQPSQKYGVHRPLGPDYTEAQYVAPTQQRIVIYRSPSARHAGVMALYLNDHYHTSLQRSAFTALCLSVQPTQLRTIARALDPARNTDTLPQLPPKAGHTTYVRVSEHPDGRPRLDLVSARIATPELQGTQKQMHAISRVPNTQDCKPTRQPPAHAQVPISMAADIWFAARKTELKGITRQSRQELDALIQKLDSHDKHNSRVRLHITGHADDHDDPYQNEQLAKLRAQTVGLYLLSNGWPPDSVTIKSPMKGVVKNVQVTTVGGVIQAGQPILEIVLTEDEMLVEAYVKPSEVAFLHVGQKAVVKLSSYDFNKYGGLDGELEHLSPDTLKDERQQRRPGGNPVDMEEGYYRILVRIKDTNLVRNGKRIEPTPGMTATVEIRTGQKTVLEYLFRPLQNVSQALRER